MDYVIADKKINNKYNRKHIKRQSIDIYTTRNIVAALNISCYAE